MEKYTVEELDNALRSVRPYLCDIENVINKLNNGIVSFDVRIFNGKVTDIVVKETKRITY